jgi:hypothetical protein
VPEQQQQQQQQQQQEKQQGEQKEQLHQQQTASPLSGAALLEQPSAWFAPRSGRSGGGEESKNADVLVPDGVLTIVGAGPAPAPPAVPPPPPLGCSLLDALDCAPVAEAQSAWALERQRDDDTVNMLQLVQALRKMRAPRS